MTRFARMLSPLRIGSVELKNRVVFGPHVTNHFPGHLADERAIAYYEERARGGVGLIIVGASPVDGRADDAPHSMPALHRDEVVPGLAKIVSAVHAHGARVFIQLLHPGMHQFPDRLEGHPAAVAPTALPTPLAPGYTAHELTRKEIHEIQDLYAAAAERAQRAGMDGVELLGVNYLIMQFLSPAKNKRTDEYGGNLENRFRFLREIGEKVRARVGHQMVVGCRVSSGEQFSGGAEVSYMVEVARLIESSKLFDYLSVSAGSMHNSTFTIPTLNAGFPYGYQAQWTGVIKAAIQLPVLMAGMINEPALVERLLEEGQADACVLVRELIAEPDFVVKAAGDRSDEIRPCAYWNQDCLGRIMTGQRLECQLNAAAGHELEFGPRVLTPSKVSRRIAIIGGGPAGMELARLVARRGHEVLVYERGHHLGGQVRQLVEMPQQRDVGRWLAWLEQDVARQSRISVTRECEVTADNLAELTEGKGAHAVVIATGARAARDGRSGLTTEPIAGHEHPHVLTYEDVLTPGKHAAIGRRVLVVDELSDRIAPAVAERLARAGHTVQLLTRWPTHGFMWLAQWNELGPVSRRLEELGVNTISGAWVQRIEEPPLVRCYRVFSQRPFDIEADTVVLVTMKYTNSSLQKVAEERLSIPFYLIGDAVTPRQITHAVRDANHLAFRIDG